MCVRVCACVYLYRYGGWLAMQGDGRLTAGRLITYQLYWNMMNSAYQSLVDIVNTFTRAGIVNMYMNAQRSACAPNP